MNSPHKLRDACPSCGGENELPYLFCAQCGAPRLKLGHWRVTLNLSLSMIAFLSTYLLRQDKVIQDYMVWDIPVFLLYSLFFYQFIVALVSGLRRQIVLVSAWFLLFFVGAACYNEYLYRYESSFFIKLVTDLPDYAIRYPLYFYGTLGIALLVIFVPAYIRWGRAFGWVMAYRVVILSLLAITLTFMGLLAAAEWVFQHGIFPQQNYWLDWLVRQSKPKYDRVLFFFAITAGRLFLIEVFIFASIHGYAQAHHGSRLAAPARLSGESPFVRSLLLLALAVRRIGHTFEQMLRYLLATLVQLSRDMAAVIRVFVREFFVPTLALGAAFALLGKLVTLSRAYATETRLLDVAEIIAGVLAVLACAVVFLGCKTRLRWGRIVGFFAQMTGWLLPNLLVLFLLLSFSLWASGKALSKFNLPEELPFRIGLLTQAGAAMLLVLVIFVLIRKRALFHPADAEPDPLHLKPTPLKMQPPPPPKSGPGGEPVIPRGTGVSPVIETHNPPKPAPPKPAKTKPAPARFSWAGSLKEIFRGGVRSLGERMNGKPPLVEQYERVQQRYLEKQARNRALMLMEKDVQLEVSSRISARYLSELRELERERQELRLKIETRLAQKTREIEDLESQVDARIQRQGEFQRLCEGEAITAAELKRQLKTLQNEIDNLKVKIEAGRQMMEFLTIKETPEREEDPVQL